MKILTLGILILILNQNLLGQSIFFPLHVGDKFKYSIKRNNPSGTTYSYTGYRITSTMTGTNGKKYFYCPGFPPLFNSWLRVDTLTSNLFYYESSSGACGNRYLNESIIDSLAMTSGGSYYCDALYTQLYEMSVHNILGTATMTKTFRKVFPSHIIGATWIRIYSDKFGLCESSYSEGGSGWYSETTYKLLGCYVNGVKYGDTNLVGVGIYDTESPVYFSLSQNYPNPFNPSTKINYEIKLSGFVSLKVFDMLGKEVAQLVNEKQSAGSYAVDFNSTEFNLPSGIYFYTLNAGEFKETKKMVLVK